MLPATHPTNLFVPPVLWDLPQPAQGQHPLLHVLVLQVTGARRVSLRAPLVWGARTIPLQALKLVSPALLAATTPTARQHRSQTVKPAP